jgi:phage baseplate assembly protein W
VAKSQEYLGTGWSFPLETNVQGGINLSKEDKDVREAIWLILGTKLGERVYRPNFGSRLSELVFAPLNPRTLFLIRLYVEEALQMWEPRINLEEIRLDPDPILGKVTINIFYRLKETYEPAMLVYPFYVVPSEG